MDCDHVITMLSVVRDLYLEASKALLYYCVSKAMMGKILTTSRCSLRINTSGHCKLSVHTNCTVAMYLKIEKLNSMASLSQEKPAALQSDFPVNKSIFQSAVTLDYDTDSEGPIKNKEASFNSSRKQQKKKKETHIDFVK